MKKRKRSTPEPSDFGPPERSNHGEVEIEETIAAGVMRLRVTTQTQCDRYFKRGEIDARQFDASERFLSAWYLGCRGARVTSNYDVRIPSSSTSAENHVGNARRTIRAALEAVGRQLSPILVHTCGLDLPANEWASKHGYSKRSGLTVLKLALDALAEHFGL